MSESEFLNDYPGIDRLYYFLGKIGMIAAMVFAVVVFGPNSGVMKILGLALMIVGMVLDVLRLQNTGLSQWFAFIRFLPFGNLALDVFLLSAQTGWTETRSWDRAGRSILLVELALLALMFFMFFRLQPSAPFWL